MQLCSPFNAIRSENWPRFSVFVFRIILGGLSEFVGPSVDDRISIDLLDTAPDAFLEFLFCCHPAVAQDRAGEFGEETLDEVEPGAVFGCEGELEAAHRFSGEPSLGFSGDMRRMVVQDQLDRCSGRVSGIEELEEFDELAAAVTLLDQGVDLAGEQINTGQ